NNDIIHESNNNIDDRRRKQSQSDRFMTLLDEYGELVGSEMVENQQPIESIFSTISISSQIHSLSNGFENITLYPATSSSSSSLSTSSIFVNGSESNVVRASLMSVASKIRHVSSFDSNENVRMLSNPLRIQVYDDVSITNATMFFPYYSNKHFNNMTTPQ